MTGKPVTLRVVAMVDGERCGPCKMQDEYLDDGPSMCRAFDVELDTKYISETAECVPLRCAACLAAEIPPRRSATECNTCEHSTGVDAAIGDNCRACFE